MCLNKRWKFDYERLDEDEIPEQELTRRRRFKERGMSVHGDAFDLLVKAERFLREHLPVAGRVDEYPDDAKARSDGGPTDSRGARGQGGDGDLDDIVGAVGTVGDAVIEIHMDLGLGLPEYVYEAVFARALGCRGAGDFTSSDRRPSGSNPMGWSSRRDFGLT
jgi:hypothetical protein